MEVLNNLYSNACNFFKLDEERKSNILSLRDNHSPLKLNYCGSERFRILKYDCEKMINDAEHYDWLMSSVFKTTALTVVLFALYLPNDIFPEPRNEVVRALGLSAGCFCVIWTYQILNRMKRIHQIHHLINWSFNHAEGTHWDAKTTYAENPNAKISVATKVQMLMLGIFYGLTEKEYENGTSPVPIPQQKAKSKKKKAKPIKTLPVPKPSYIRQLLSWPQNP